MIRKVVVMRQESGRLKARGEADDGCTTVKVGDFLGAGGTGRWRLFPNLPLQVRGGVCVEN